LKSPLAADLLRSARELEADLLSFRRELHQFPELSWNEHETAKRIQNELSNSGISFVSGKAGGTGLWAELGSGEKTIGYRTDIDALPIQDLITAWYSSKIDGVGHECGHDVHTTIAVGICKLLKKYLPENSGKIRVLFQPAEETQPSGAPAMIQDGAVDGLSALFAIHVDPNYPAGQIALLDGPITASYVAFDVRFTAPAALHSARPHNGPNAMMAALDFAQQSQLLPFKTIDSRRPAVVTVTNFHAGEAINVVPAKARVQGTIRTRFNDDSPKLTAALEHLAHSLAIFHGCTVEIAYSPGAPAVENAAHLVDFSRGAINEFNSFFTGVPFYPSMGGEDFSYYGKLIPITMLRLGTQSSPETAHALHSNHFDVDEQVIAPATAFLTYLLLAYLKSHTS
jgi:amidohydrolase